MGWSREVPADAPLALLVHLDRPPGRADEAALLREAIHQFFAARAEEARRRLRHLFHLGRVSLAIGLAVLAACIGVAQLVVRWTGGTGVGQVLHESLLIGGWVAMWRPLEVFLYDWWPIRADVRLFHRLAAMPVRLRYATDANVRRRRRALATGLAGGVRCKRLGQYRRRSRRTAGSPTTLTSHRVFFASGDWTCSIARFTGTMTGPMKGPDGKDIPPTAKSFDWSSARWHAGTTGRSWKRTCYTTW